MPNHVRLKDLVFEKSIAAEKIQERVRELGAQLSQDFEGEIPLFIAILNGSFMFAADLMRAYDGQGELTFVKLASYEGTASTGKVMTMIGLEAAIKGRHVVIVEDIIDSGETLHQFLPELEKMLPASINLAVLLLKPDAVKYDFEINYLGFKIPNDFVIGYGMDYDGLGRNLADLYKKADNFLIKRGDSSEFETLLNLARDTFDRTYRHLNDQATFDAYMEKAFSSENFKKQFINPNSFFGVAYEKGKMIGYLKINEGDAQTVKDDPDAVEIERIYFLKEMQGKGYGRKMVDAVFEYAKKRNKQRIWLGVWEHNPAAMKFYEKCGFEKCGEKVFQLGPEKQTDFIMDTIISRS